MHLILFLQFPRLPLAVEISILSDFVNLLSFLSNVSYNFILVKDNFAAHNLPKFALVSDVDSTWFVVIPECIFVFIQKTKTHKQLYF